MAFPNSEINLIAAKILVDAQGALEHLRAMSASTDSATERLQILKEVVKKTAAQMGGDFKKATAEVRAFAGALTGIKAQEVNIAGRMASQESGRLSSMNNMINNLRNAYMGVSGEAQKAGAAGQEAGKKTESGINRAVSAVNALRIAMGVLVSMLVFQVLTAISTVFGNAIKQAREFEATLYRISNVERVLSLEGIEVSVKQLKQGIRDIKEALPIFSEEDIAQLVGSVATTTKELGYTGDEIIKLSAAIGILNINSTETESLLATQAKVTNSLISPQSKSVGSLGLAFGKAKIEAKAFEMQILKAGESFADLTEKQKQEIKFQIVLETAGIDDIPIDELREKIREAGGDFQALNEYLESNDARLQENKAAWNDFLRELGQLILPFLPALTELMRILQVGTIFLKIFALEGLARLGTVGVVVMQIMNGNIKSIDDLTNTIKQSMEILRGDLTNTFFKEVPKDAPDWFMRGWGDLIKQDAETATTALEGMNDEAADNDEALQALDDLDDKLREIALDAKQAQEDLDLKFSQKRGDLNVEYDRKAADAARDHAQKIEDINRDSLDKVADAKRKAREDEKKAEQDLLQKLKELRQRFLMDLDDALRARDARQILRLIKEYNFEKQNILDRKKLDDKQRKEKLADDLKAIEEDRKRRIQQEQIEYKRRLEDLRIAKQREIDELNLWYAREQEDIQRNVKQKLEKLLDGYIQEGILHEEQLSDIEGILAKHFGTQMGMVDNLVAYMQTRFAQMASMSVPVGAPTGYAPLPPSFYQNAPLTGSFIGGGGQSVLTPTGAQPIKKNTRTPTVKPNRVPAYADGGTLFAKKPTLALFGEKTPEFARFIPASQMGRGGGGDMMGMNGEIGLELMLSPDLEARVVKNAMQGTAKIVTKIRRSKT